MDKKFESAIQLLRDNEPKDGKGYGLAFSGGKDSIVIKQLAIESGVKFNAFYSVTTIDPPELVRFIKEYHSDVAWLRNPKGGFFKRLIEKGIPPSFMIRWCCAEFKEQSLREYSAKIIGVRAAESPRRAKRWKSVVDDNQQRGAIIVCPIVDWSDADVWHFIASRKLPYCSLYDDGFSRLGCIGCPLASAKNRRAELARWPSYEKAYRQAFCAMWERWHNVIIEHKHKNAPSTFAPHYAAKFANGDEWFEHYFNRGNAPLEDCQMELMFVGGSESEVRK